MSVCQSIQCRHQTCLHLGYLISLHSTLSVIEFGRITRPENKCVNQDSLSLRLFPCSSHILHNSCPSPSCGTKLRHFITGNQFLFLGILSSFSTDIVALAFFCEISTTNEQRLLGSGRTVDMSLSVSRVSGERESKKSAEERLEVREDNIVRF